MSQTAVAPAGSLAVPLSSGRIVIEPWRSERPLFLVSMLVSLLLWVAATVSIVGLIYGAMFGVFFFLMHVFFVAQVRGSGVRIGPEQFPELHARVELLAQRMGMERAPDTYLMQAGGSLNALATRFLRANIVVLFSDLLEACGENEAARDMIIAHELGHIHAGHLRWRLALLPSKLVPFLGPALSRAREYTCDRYGLAGAGDRDAARLGLTILSAGGSHAPRVNYHALVRQAADIDTGWMTIGEWCSSHPPLVKRLEAIDPSLRSRTPYGRTGVVRALAILSLVVVPALVAIGMAISRLPSLLDGAEQEETVAEQAGLPAAEAAVEIDRAFAAMSDFLAAERAAGRPLPESAGELYNRWSSANPGLQVPLDPYDGDILGYTREGDSFSLWSSGPDREPRTSDDLVFRP